MMIISLCKMLLRSSMQTSIYFGDKFNCFNVNEAGEVLWWS